MVDKIVLHVPMQFLDLVEGYRQKVISIYDQLVAKGFVIPLLLDKEKKGSSLKMDVAVREGDDEISVPIWFNFTIQNEKTSLEMMKIPSEYDDIFLTQEVLMYLWERTYKQLHQELQRSQPSIQYTTNPKLTLN